MKAENYKTAFIDSEPVCKLPFVSEYVLVCMCVRLERRGLLSIKHCVNMNRALCARRMCLCVSMCSYVPMIFVNDLVGKCWIWILLLHKKHLKNVALVVCRAFTHSIPPNNAVDACIVSICKKSNNNKILAQWAWG